MIEMAPDPTSLSEGRDGSLEPALTARVETIETSAGLSRIHFPTKAPR
jgi:hypothetical protein